MRLRTLARAISCCACRNVWFTRARRILQSKILPIESYARSRIAFDTASCCATRSGGRNALGRSLRDLPLHPAVLTMNGGAFAFAKLLHLGRISARPRWVSCWQGFLLSRRGGSRIARFFFLVWHIFLLNALTDAHTALRARSRIAFYATSWYAPRSGGRKAPRRSPWEPPRQPTRGSRVGLFVPARVLQEFFSFRFRSKFVRTWVRRRRQKLFLSHRTCVFRVGMQCLLVCFSQQANL